MRFHTKRVVIEGKEVDVKVYPISARSGIRFDWKNEPVARAAKTTKAKSVDSSNLPEDLKDLLEEISSAV